MNQKIFITTAIPYINANAHIGHAQEFLLADTLSRFYKLQGHEVYLQSGTDDNSLKNVEAAKKKGVDLGTYLLEQGQQFKDLLTSLRIHPDYFIRTSSKEHTEGVQHFIRSLKQEDLYEGTYVGLYCGGCEDFLKEKDLEGGNCKDHKKPPTPTEEKNIFFRLSAYQSQIRELIEKDIVKISPASKKEEVLGFIEQGLEDISISRPNNDAIGVPFPNKEGQSVYVWIDALVNYITGSGYPNSSHKKVWSEDVYKIHVIGKNVWKFHAIYWVGLLLSAGLPVPNEILVHGFLTVDGEKISKSTGNAIDPLDILKTTEADVIRTYLLGKLSYEKDSDFSSTGLQVFFKEELLGQIANLFPRVQSLAKKFGHRLQKGSVKYPKTLPLLFKEIQEKTWSLNKNINDSVIWKEQDPKKIKKHLENWGPRVHELSQLVKPFWPSKEEPLDKALEEKIILFKKE